MARNYSTEFTNMGWPSPYSGIPAYSPMPPSCIGFPYHPSVNLHYPLAPSCGTFATLNIFCTVLTHLFQEISKIGFAT